MSSSTTASIRKQLQDEAQALGFELFGVARVQELPDVAFFESWLEKGYSADMGYLAANKARRTNPEAVVEGAQSVVICATNYHTDAPLSTAPARPGEGWITRYAWGDDYHLKLEKKIAALYRHLQELTGGEAKGRYYVDTGPVLERAWARLAGIGWIGKNTCLISPVMGSFIFLAAIITDFEMSDSDDDIVPDRCGSCTRCIDACPTGALLEPFILDARRCISYLTIENKSEIPLAYRESQGRHLFGCDICQDVCPWNRKIPVSTETAFQPREQAVNPAISHILALDPASFREKFRKSPIKRTKFKGLIRNALIAAGNSRDPNLMQCVEKYLQDADSLIQEHAEWAYNKLMQDTEHGGA